MGRTIRNAEHGEKTVLVGSEAFAINDATANPATPHKFVEQDSIKTFVLSGLGINDISGLQTALDSNTTLANNAQVDATSAKTKTDFITVTGAVNLDNLSTSSHSHANKALLDTYTQTEVDLANAVSNSHTHANKALLDTYTQTEGDLSNAVSNSHTHANKAILDNISDSGSGTVISLSERNYISRNSTIQAITGSGAQNFDLNLGFGLNLTLTGSVTLTAQNVQQAASGVVHLINTDGLSLTINAVGVVFAIEDASGNLVETADTSGPITLNSGATTKQILTYYCPTATKFIYQITTA